MKSGGAFQGGVSGRWETEELDLNDVGYLSAPDEIAASGWLSYRHHPGNGEGAFQEAVVDASVWKGWFYGGGSGFDRDTGERVWSYGRGHPRPQGIEVSGWGQLRTYWSAWAGTGYETRGSSKYDTRTFEGARGPLMEDPASLWTWAGLHTDYRKPLSFEVNTSVSWNARGGRAANLNLWSEWQATGSMTYSVGLGYSTYHGDAQHVDNFENPGGGIGGVSYVFAEFDQKTIDATLRGDILFTRDLSLQLYAQPYLTVGDYRNPRELMTPDSYDLEPVGVLPGFEPEDVHGYDFRYAAVNLNAVLRWEYAPGSTLFLVWKQGREFSDDRASTPGLDPRLDPGDLFRSEPENVLLAKVTYWLPL